MTALLAHLGEGKPVRTFPRAEGDPILPVLRDLHFLTDKKTIYCANVAEDDLADPLTRTSRRSRPTRTHRAAKW